MEILIGNKGHVDFDAPIKVTDKQKRQILKFLKTTYSVVEEETVNQFRTQRIGDKFFIKGWSDKEYDVLFEIKDTEKVSEMLGRSWMSVNIRRGIFFPEFLSWAEKNNKDLVKGDVKSYIKEFSKEKRDLLSLKKEKKKTERREIKNIESELKSLDGRRKTILFLIDLGQADKEDLKKLDEEEKQLKSKLECLEKNNKF